MVGGSKEEFDTSSISINCPQEIKGKQRIESNPNVQSSTQKAKTFHHAAPKEDTPRKHYVAEENREGSEEGRPSYTESHNYIEELVAQESDNAKVMKCNPSDPKENTYRESDVTEGNPESCEIVPTLNAENDKDSDEQVTDNSKYACEKCSKSFSYYKQMLKHQKNCGKSFQCSKCNKTLKTKKH